MSPHPSAVLRVLPGVLLTLAGSSAALGDPPPPAVINLSALNGTNGFTLNGIDSGDQAGYCVSSAGDVNADGIDDILIGALWGDPNGQTDAGETYVVFGKDTSVAGGFAPSINLSTLNGTTGFVINGVNIRDISGIALSAAGDINGDGIDDILIGARTLSQAGKAHVVFGGPNVGSSGSLNLSALNGVNGFTLNGITPYDRCGSAVSGAGDINGDGIDDLLIGAHGADPNGMVYAGQAYVVFGKNTSVAGAFAPSISLSSLNGTTGFTINGNEQYGCGGDVSSAGDVNGDGLDDLLISAGAISPGFGLPRPPGRVYVLFGKNTSVDGPFGATIEWSSLTGIAGFALIGIDPNDGFGGVSYAGDVNADGVNDILVSARDADPDEAHFHAGQTYVVFGGPAVGATGSIAMASLDGTNGFVLNGTDLHDWSGWSTSTTGDVNGDGIDDFLIGAKGGPGSGPSNGQAGQSYVVYGRDTSVTGNYPASINLSSLDWNTGFRINGIKDPDQSGWSVSSAGDVNHDGLDDILIGAVLGGSSQRGQAYVVFGFVPPNICTGDVNNDGLTNVSDFNILALNFGAGPGATLAQGDLSGDGFVDVADFNILAGDFGCAP